MFHAILHIGGVCLYKSVMASVSSRSVGIKAEVLNDLSSRFLINLSSEERDPVKLCTYIELAHWYYLDLMRPEDTSLPACNLKEFMKTLLQHCPWLLRESSAQDLDKLIADWKSHKFKKPVRGAIILNHDMTKCVLVQGYSSGVSWGFPKGKLEEGEEDIDAAVREVYEETGFDIRVLIRRKHFLDASVRDSHVRMYVITGVAETTAFEPKTRNEIKSIKWFNISDLPAYKKDKGSLQGKSSNNFFMIIPFIGQLRRWIKSRRKGISANFQGTGENTPHQGKTTPLQRASVGVARSKTSLPQQASVGVARSKTTPPQQASVGVARSQIQQASVGVTRSKTTASVGVARSKTTPLQQASVGVVRSNTTPPQQASVAMGVVRSKTTPPQQPFVGVAMNNTTLLGLLPTPHPAPYSANHTHFQSLPAASPILQPRPPLTSHTQPHPLISGHASIVQPRPISGHAPLAQTRPISGHARPGPIAQPRPLISGHAPLAQPRPISGHAQPRPLISGHAPLAQPRPISGQASIQPRPLIGRVHTMQPHPSIAGHGPILLPHPLIASHAPIMLSHPSLPHPRHYVHNIVPPTIHPVQVVTPISQQHHPTTPSSVATPPTSQRHHPTTPSSAATPPTSQQHHPTTPSSAATPPTSQQHHLTTPSSVATPMSQHVATPSNPVTKVTSTSPAPEQRTLISAKAWINFKFDKGAILCQFKSEQ